MNATPFYPVQVPTASRYHGTRAVDSNDVEAIRNQVLDMQYAGQQVGLYSWAGRTSFAERAFANHLRAADDTSFRWAILDELEGVAGPNGGDPTVAQIKADLDHLYAAYGNDSSYFRVGGKPVIFAYNDAGDTCNMATRWSQANGGRFYVVLKVVPGYTRCSQPSSWWGYDPSQRGFLAGNSYSVSPGFWKVNESSPRLARSVAAFAGAVRTMKSAAVRFRIATTWNEWYDGTSIASAKEWASSSGNGSYADQLHSILGQAPSTPGPPSVVSASTSGQDIDLTWNAVSGATSYQVWRNGCLAATVTGTSWTDTAFNSASASYFVKSVNARGTSRRSPVRIGTAGTPSPAPAPTGSEGLRAVAGERLVLTTTGSPGFGCGARQRGQAVLTLPASVPANATAVVLAVHAISPLGGGGVTLYPAGATAPAITQLRYYSTRAASNTTVVGIGTGKQIVLQESGNATHLVVDLLGYAAPGEQGVVAHSNLGGQTVGSSIAASAAGTETVALPSYIPSDAQAVQVRVQVRSAPAAGYATLYSGSTKPGITSLQYAPSVMETTSVLVPVDAARTLHVFHSTAATLTVGIEGWTTGSGGNPVVPSASRLVATTSRQTAVNYTFPAAAYGKVAMLNLGVATAGGYGTLGVTPYGGKTIMAQVNYGPQQPQSGFTWVRVPSNGIVGLSSSQGAFLYADQLALG